MAAECVIFMGTSAWEGKLWNLPENDPHAFYLLLGCIILNFVAEMTANAGIQHCRVDRASIASVLEVPCTYVLGACLLGELPSAMQVFGFVLITASGVMISVPGENM